MSLAFTEHDPDGETYGVAAQMDLGAEPTARTTERLIVLLGLFAGGAAMRRMMVLSIICNMSSVPPLSASAWSKRSHTPDSLPATELLPHGVPFAERGRQVAPRRSGSADPEDAIQPVPMVLRVDAHHARRA